ncbi:hypothetical protein Z043_121717, partial [Scleropages formosus]
SSQRKHAPKRHFVTYVESAAFVRVSEIRRGAASEERAGSFACKDELLGFQLVTEKNDERSEEERRSERGQRGGEAVHMEQGAPLPGRVGREDVIYWFRQIIAVILGIIWGIVPLKGFLGIAIFCIINAGLLYVYFSSFQQVDEEEYGGTWELTKEGFMTSFALFLVVWIIFYTALHYE